eukprot:3308966-Rhodomonas_salina.4
MIRRLRVVLTSSSPAFVRPGHWQTGATGSDYNVRSGPELGPGLVSGGQHSATGHGVQEHWVSLAT